MRPPMQYNDVYKMISISFFHKYKTKFDMHDNFYRKITNLIPQHNKHIRFALSTDYSVPMYCKTTGQNQNSGIPYQCHFGKFQQQISSKTN